ncbi:MAG: diguanylate cyclase [Polyangiaceae bacterium]
MARIVLVDDSPSVLSLLGPRLEAAGHEVRAVVDAYAGADLTLADPPDVVVTDLWMPGMSGLQLCRLLKAEVETTHVPVVLLTASDDKKSRFWADRSGAAAFVTKQGIDELLRVVDSLTREHAGRVRSGPASRGRPGVRGSIQGRLAQLLDTALYESVLAGEVRALASAGSFDGLGAALAALLSNLVHLRFVALQPLRGATLLFARAEAMKDAELEAREALSLDASAQVVAFPTPHAEQEVLAGAVFSETVTFGEERQGRLVVGAAGRRLVAEDERALKIVASELGGPMRMAALVGEAQRLAATDSLTGLSNRRAFVEMVARDVSLAHRHGWPLSVLLLDLDHFKRVNDERGHAAGDAVLAAVADALARTVRKSDLVARWGGEEFVVALSHTAVSGARVMAERLRRQIGDRKVEVPSLVTRGAVESISVTASIGVGTLAPGDSLEALVARADAAMYNAKSRGRNRVESL